VNLRQLPNLITGVRMLLVLPLMWSLRDGDYDWSLVIALAAGGSDAVDGWLAKRYRWQTRLGGLLDPVADKLLLVASFVGLWLAGASPGWLTALVIGRDVVIVAGAVVYNAVVGPVDANPTLLSKVTTVAQIGLVLALLVGLAWRPLPVDVSIGSIWLVAALTFVSGIDYVVRWSLLAHRELRARRR